MLVATRNVICLLILCQCAFSDGSSHLSHHKIKTGKCVRPPHEHEGVYEGPVGVKTCVTFQKLNSTGHHGFGYRRLISNGIPDHSIIHHEKYPLCEAFYKVDLPISPAPLEDPISTSDYPIIGFALNGVPLYHSFSPDEDGERECFGHPAGKSGHWHYHRPPLFTANASCVHYAYQMAGIDSNTQVGYALDGNPIYAPLEKQFEKDKGRYEVDDILDECNGRLMPDGEYRYHVRTIDHVRTLGHNSKTHMLFLPCFKAEPATIHTTTGCGPVSVDKVGEGNQVCPAEAPWVPVHHQMNAQIRIFNTSGCPPHPWLPTPNLPRYTYMNWTLPPPRESATTTAVGLGSGFYGPIGVAVNGVPWYAPVTAGGDDAVVSEGASFDACGGHADAAGVYHYHGMPHCLLAELGDSKDAHSPLLGWALDGYEIYGPRNLQGYWPLDLDECNGHRDVEHREYHYHVTDWPGLHHGWPIEPVQRLGYPYVIGCFRGCLNFTTVCGYVDTNSTDAYGNVTTTTAWECSNPNNPRIDTSANCTFATGQHTKRIRSEYWDPQVLMPRAHIFKTHTNTGWSQYRPQPGVHQRRGKDRWNRQGLEAGTMWRHFEDPSLHGTMQALAPPVVYPARMTLSHPGPSGPLRSPLPGPAAHGRARTVVTGVAAYTPDGYYGAGAVLYLLVTFSSPVQVQQFRWGGMPTLHLQTGRHFEEHVHNSTAYFIGGGVGEHRAFWRNHDSSPVHTELSALCRAGAGRNSALIGRAMCEFSPAEQRSDQLMFDTIVFEYRVHSGDRTPRLDYASRTALQLNGATITTPSPTTEVLNAVLDGGPGAPARHPAGAAHGPPHARARWGFVEAGPGATVGDPAWGAAQYWARQQPSPPPHIVDLTLDVPADSVSGAPGGAQSLSGNSHFIIGNPFATNVTYGVPSGTYGWNKAFRGEQGYSRWVPDVIEIHVSFSEPIVVKCDWVVLASVEGHHGGGGAAGAGRRRVCLHIYLVLDTGRLTADTTEGKFGTELFPTSFLYEPEDRPEERGLRSTLTFRYTVRRYDHTDRLTYIDEHSLKVRHPASLHRDTRTTPTLPYSHPPYPARRPPTPDITIYETIEVSTPNTTAVFNSTTNTTEYITTHTKTNVTVPKRITQFPTQELSPLNEYSPDPHAREDHHRRRVRREATMYGLHVEVLHEGLGWAEEVEEDRYTQEPVGIVLPPVGHACSLMGQPQRVMVQTQGKSDHVHYDHLTGRLANDMA